MCSKLNFHPGIFSLQHYLMLLSFDYYLSDISENNFPLNFKYQIYTHGSITLLMEWKPRVGLLRTPFFLTVFFLINLLIKRIITLVPQILTIDSNYLVQNWAFMMQTRSESLFSEIFRLRAKDRAIVSLWTERLVCETLLMLAVMFSKMWRKVVYFKRRQKPF